MTKYIDAEKLQAEIEKYLKDVKNAAKRYTPNMGFFDAKLSGIYNVMGIVASFQQEQPEVDFEIEYAKFSNDIDAQYPFPIDLSDYREFALHFYELGLNARKED